MNATELLKRDHAEIQALLAELARATAMAPGATAGRVRRQLIETLGNALDVHMELEHEMFYPAAREIEGAVGLVQAAELEHDEVRELLAVVLGMDAGDQEAAVKIDDLQKAFLHHASEEERLVFRKVGELDAAALERLGGELADRKRELLDGTSVSAGRRPPRTGRRGSRRAA
jgi:iron-sulfur cluster repair protein YtfE (RIC family)